MHAPALLSAWSSGSVKGLRAPGRITVDITWEKGALTAATLSGTVGAPLTVVYGKKRVATKIPENGTLRLEASSFN
ncbi:MAG: glycoside hydrolase family 95-like protein [Luteolibacter sp.]